MDIIDILIARAKSFPGETAALVKAAQNAMAQANAVADKAEDIQELLEDAEAVNERAEAIASGLEDLQEDISTAVNTAVENTIDDRIEAQLANMPSVTVSSNDTNSYKSTVVTVGNASTTVEKNYTSTGQNEDGSMTQKAITAALQSVATSNENSGSGLTLPQDIVGANYGTIIIADGKGSICAGLLKEEELIAMQLASGYTVSGVIGVEIDYINKTVSRVQESVNLMPGTDFNKYQMFGGRKRVLITDEGVITELATTGGSQYYGSSGQVMVEQPPFYYLRKPLATSETGVGTVINKELLLLSDYPLPGFTLHPAFPNEHTPIYFSAFEGCAQNSDDSYVLNDAQDIDLNTARLSSIAGAKPISGQSQNFTMETAYEMAVRRGLNWNIMDITDESVNQMLMLVEYASLNLQQAFNKGITNITNRIDGINCSCLTGSTMSLLNTSGMAPSTTQTIGNTSHTYNNEEGKCAISYRGMENPYGNIWRFVCNTIFPNGQTGELIISTKNNDKEIMLPVESGWISAFQYVNDAEQVFVPILVNGSSSIPVGDYCYVTNNLSDYNTVVIGGSCSSGDYAGIFYYGFDANLEAHNSNYSARLIYKSNFPNIPNPGGGLIK